MRMVKLLIFAAFAMFAFGAVGTTVAMAEEPPPEILCLEKGCIKELEGHFETNAGAVSTLETLGTITKALELTATKALALIKKCEALNGTEEKDANLCKDQEIHFEGVEEPAKKVKCKSEATNGGDKDPNAGEVLVLLDLHLASELNEAGTALEPLLLAKVLGPLLENELLIKCGVINIKVRGTVGCLITSGLTNIGAKVNFSIVCKLNKTTHDAETGKCEILCAWLTEFPFEATNLKGEFEMAWENISLEGSANKDIFIDD